LGETLQPSRYPTNLYRDDEFKTSVQHFRHRSLVTQLEALVIPEIPLNSKNIKIEQSIVKSPDLWQFKEGSTKVVTLAAPQKPVK